MTRGWRWLIVAAGTAALAVAPLAAGLLPAGHSSIGAPELLARIQASAGVQYSGYGESSGGLALPVTTDRFTSLNDLFGDSTQLRVWWRAADDWRVDAVDLAGESDLHGDRVGIWTWDYETNTAQRAVANLVPIVRLPRSEDLVPATLARRLLSQASPARVTRLPDARIAGHDAAGLRLDTADARSTIEHIDVWALPDDGLPVRVKIYGAHDPAPVLATTLLDLSTSAPASSTTAFRPAAGAKIRSEQFGDIVAAVDQFGSSHPPAQLAGLPRQPLELGSVGVYGRGVTALVAVPVPPRLARTLVTQLSATPGSATADGGISVGIGPLNLLLSEPGFDGARWLLAGTVTPSTLVSAAAELPPAAGFRR
jgi:hypothetical protein